MKTPNEIEAYTGFCEHYGFGWPVDAKYVEQAETLWDENPGAAWRAAFWLGQAPRSQPPPLDEKELDEAAFEYANEVISENEDIVCGKKYEAFKAGARHGSTRGMPILHRKDAIALAQKQFATGLNGIDLAMAMYDWITGAGK